MTTHAEPGYEFLEKAHLVLFALQFSMVASILARDGEDGLRGGVVGLVAATIAVFAANRRLAGDAANRGAVQWIVAWRTGLLSVLAVATLLVTLGPSRAAVPGAVRELPIVLIWVVLCLKGAAIGKLKPNGLLGLRVPWTLRSHLAWDRAHRTLGRILFWGGLLGLAASPAVSLQTTLALLALVVTSGITVALAESWHVWRSDPERS